MSRYREAFDLLEWSISDKQVDLSDPYLQSYRRTTALLLQNLAQRSEDALYERLESPHAPFKDWHLTVEDPTAGEDLRGQGLRGSVYRWATNWRILAPPGPHDPAADRED